MNCERLAPLVSSTFWFLWIISVCNGIGYMAINQVHYSICAASWLCTSQKDRKPWWLA